MFAERKSTRIRWLMRLSCLALGACGDDDSPDRLDAAQSDGGDRTISLVDAGGRAGDASTGGATGPIAEGAACRALSGQRVATCAERDGTTGGGSTSFDITGTVDEITTAPFHCLGAWGPSNEGPNATTWQFRISDGIESYRVGLSLPSGLLAVGDQVRVEYSGGLYVESSEAHLVVRRADGALLAWISKSNLAPPAEVHVTSAGRPCSFEDVCGTVERDGLHVSIDGDEAVLEYGESTVLGGYAVWHGGNDTIPQSKCPGVFGSRITIAVFAANPPEPDAGP